MNETEVSRLIVLNTVLSRCPGSWGIQYPQSAVTSDGGGVVIAQAKPVWVYNSGENQSDVPVELHTGWSWSRLGDCDREKAEEEIAQLPDGSELWQLYAECPEDAVEVWLAEHDPVALAGFTLIDGVLRR